MRNLTSFISGSLFGLGLIISGMTDTAKVQGWLDVFGNWDPTLAFVLGGAILPMLFTWQYAKRRQTSFLGTPMPDPPAQTIGRKLVVGSFLFGAGWGLAGLCPGPAMASLTFNGSSGLLFFGAMIVGMWLAVPLKRQFPQTT
jgi:uncharacterized membrane protein YedE/YeeE